MNYHSSKRRITVGFHSLTAQLVFLFLFFLSGGGGGAFASVATKKRGLF